MAHGEKMKQKASTVSGGYTYNTIQLTSITQQSWMGHRLILKEILVSDLKTLISFIIFYFLILKFSPYIFDIQEIQKIHL